MLSDFLITGLKCNRSIKVSIQIILVFLIVFTPMKGLIPISVSAEELPYADYIFCNGNIVTIDENNTIAEAIAVVGNTIVAIGSDEEILSSFGLEGTETYDLGGLTIMPGIIDGHTHMIASTAWYGINTLVGAQEAALKYGYTGLTEKSFDFETDIFQAETNGDLRIRVNLFPIYNLAHLNSSGEPFIIEQWYLTRDPILDAERKLRVPGIKIYADGYSGARGFPAMSTPYPQDLMNMWGVTNPYGDLYFNQSELNAIVKKIQDRGFSCGFHSMGDRSTETVLNAIEFALGNETNDIHRHQIEHNSFIRDDLVLKAQVLDTIHSVRGYFPTYYQEDYEAIYPPDWLEWNIKRYSLPNAGLHCYLESDFGWRATNNYSISRTSNINPFLHLWGYVTRKAMFENGTIVEPLPWLAQHQITVEQALRMLTYEGAYAVKQEEYLGSLEQDKLADIIIISDNPLTTDVDNLKDIEVLLTMVDGNIEYYINDTFLQQYEGATGGISLQPLTMILLTISMNVIVVIIRKKKK
nr:putative TIM-barrel fold metal-dependent hydrolase [Candidatus Heimdallarchaeota archaeon]